MLSRMFVSYFLCLCKNVMSHVFCMCFVSLYSFFYCAFKSLQDSQDSQTVPPTTAVAASEVPSVMAAAEMLDVLLQGPEKRQIQLLWTISRSQRLRRSQIQKRNSWRIRRNRRKWQKQRQNQEARIARLPRGSLGQRMERSHPMLCMFLGKVSPRMYRRNLNKDAADAAFVHFAPDHVGSREVGGCETPSHRIWFDCLVSVETTWLIHLFTNSSMS